MDICVYLQFIQSVIQESMRKHRTDRRLLSTQWPHLGQKAGLLAPNGINLESDFSTFLAKRSKMY